MKVQQEALDQSVGSAESTAGGMTTLARFTTPPASPGTAALEAYRSQARDYDQRTDAFQHWRERLVAQLPLHGGDTVLDVGCGTGLCMPLVQQEVGRTGAIVGIDASEQMLAVADERVVEHGWSNVRLIAGPVETASIDVTADAALFCAVHDVLQSRAALENIVGRLRPGAAVAAVGGKWPAPWMWPMHAWIAGLHAPFISDFTGFGQPWRLLAELIPDLRIREIAYGGGYLAVGHTSQPDPDGPS